MGALRVGLLLRAARARHQLCRLMVALSQDSLANSRTVCAGRRTFVPLRGYKRASCAAPAAYWKVQALQNEPGHGRWQFAHHNAPPCLSCALCAVHCDKSSYWATLLSKNARLAHAALRVVRGGWRRSGTPTPEYRSHRSRRIPRAHAWGTRHSVDALSSSSNTQRPSTDERYVQALSPTIQARAVQACRRPESPRLAGTLAA